MFCKREKSDMNERRGSDTVIGRALTASADSDYKENLRDVRKLLADIEKALKDHESRQKKQPNDYGYVGDLGHAVSELQEVNKSLR